MTATIVRDLQTQGWAVVETGIATADLMACYSAWHTFFSSEVKLTFSPTDGGLQGYFPFESEKARRSKCFDPKEFFHYYAWNSCPPECHAITDRIWKSLQASALRFLETTLFVCGDTDLCAVLGESRRQMLRIAHYCARANPEIFAAAHTDINLFTLLPPATHGGLEVFDRQKKAWVSLPDLPEGWATVLIGDMMAEVSRGRFEATLHRVVAGSSERISLSFFANPSDDTQLSPRMTAGDMLNNRSGRIGQF